MKQLYRIFVPLFIGLLTLTACGGDSEEKQSDDTPNTEVTFQLDWVHTIEYAGFYMAQNHDLYKDKDLSVTFVEGGFNSEGQIIDTVEQVVNGDADFGLARGEELLAARDEGKPVVAIATVYQRDPLALLSLAESEIRRPEDLVGKTIEASRGVALIAFLTSQDLIDDVTIVERRDFTNNSLLNGDVDVVDAFITNQPIALKNDGHDINLILLSDYGIDIYPDVIFTTETMLAEQPELVKRFLEASLAGYQLAVDQPQAAAEATVAKSDQLVLEFETESMQVSIPLIVPSRNSPGLMTNQAWEYTYDVLVNQGRISETLNVADAYTLRFLNEIYGE